MSVEYNNSDQRTSNKGPRPMVTVPGLISISLLLLFFDLRNALILPIISLFTKQKITDIDS